MLWIDQTRPLPGSAQTSLTLAKEESVDSLFRRKAAHQLLRRNAQMIRTLIAATVVSSCSAVYAQAPADSAALARSVEQLRAAAGRWDVVTDYLNDDGSVAQTVTGTYEFSWVVLDRVLIGRNEIPALNQASGILFYINEAKQKIEMVSVGGDGALWIMTGELGEEVRYTQEYPTQDGGTGQLRFTRYNVTRDSFESKMEWTDDGGNTWTPANHQVFRRVVE